MPLQTSGAISMANINTELGNSSTATISLNSSTARGLAGIASGTIRLSNFYGKSRGVPVQWLLGSGGAGGGGRYWYYAGGGGSAGTVVRSGVDFLFIPGVDHTIVIGAGGSAGTFDGYYGTNGSPGGLSYMTMQIAGTGTITFYASSDANITGATGTGGYAGNTASDQAGSGGGFFNWNNISYYAGGIGGLSTSGGGGGGASVTGPGINGYDYSYQGGGGAGGRLTLLSGVWPSGWPEIGTVFGVTDSAAIGWMGGGGGGAGGYEADAGGPAGQGGGYGSSISSYYGYYDRSRIDGRSNSSGGGGGSGSHDPDGYGGSGGSGVCWIQYPNSYPAATHTGSMVDISSVTPGYRSYRITSSGNFRIG